MPTIETPFPTLPRLHVLVKGEGEEKIGIPQTLVDDTILINSTECVTLNSAALEWVVREKRAAFVARKQRDPLLPVWVCCDVESVLPRDVLGFYEGPWRTTQQKRLLTIANACRRAMRAVDKLWFYKCPHFPFYDLMSNEPHHVRRLPFWLQSVMELAPVIDRLDGCGLELYADSRWDRQTCYNYACSAIRLAQPRVGGFVVNVARANQRAVVPVLMLEPAWPEDPATGGWLPRDTVLGYLQACADCGVEEAHLFGALPYVGAVGSHTPAQWTVKLAELFGATPVD